MLGRWNRGRKPANKGWFITSAIDMSDYSLMLQGNWENYPTQVGMELGGLPTNSHQTSFEHCFQEVLMFRQPQAITCKDRGISMVAKKAPGTEMQGWRDFEERNQNKAGGLSLLTPCPGTNWKSAIVYRSPKDTGMGVRAHGAAQSWMSWVFLGMKLPLSGYLEKLSIGIVDHKLQSEWGSLLWYLEILQ